jgi:prepilin-type N-terminal cleavage/methylation domain-containing protein
MGPRVRDGYTLTEVMVTVLIIGIVASMALPGYQRTMERGYWRGAQDILRAIYAGEQVYETANDQYIDPANCNPAWRCIYMDDPNVGGGTPVAFSVEVCNPPVCNPPTFTATAFRGDGRCMSINQARVLALTSAAAGCSNPWPQP